MISSSIFNRLVDLEFRIKDAVFIVLPRDRSIFNEKLKEETVECKVLISSYVSIRNTIEPVRYSEIYIMYIMKIIEIKLYLSRGNYLNHPVC